jgi:hypothetical protein
VWLDEKRLFDKRLVVVTELVCDQLFDNLCPYGQFCCQSFAEAGSLCGISGAGTEHTGAKYVDTEHTGAEYADAEHADAEHTDNEYADNKYAYTDSKYGNKDS